MFNENFVAIAVVDCHWRVVEANRSFGKLFGDTNTFGKCLTDYVDEKDTTVLTLLQVSGCPADHAPEEISLVFPDSRRVPVQV